MDSVCVKGCMNIMFQQKNAVKKMGRGAIMALGYYLTLLKFF